MIISADTRTAIRAALAQWDAIYAAALEPGPHNPTGAADRAEQLTRAWMSARLRMTGDRHDA